MKTMYHFHSQYTSLIALAAIGIALFSPSASADVIVTEHYTIQIEHPGFRMSVVTPTGVALPADTTTGLSFLGSRTVSSKRLSQADDATTYRVTNGDEETALVRFVTKPQTIELTVTLENARSGNISMRTGSPGPAYGLGDHGGWEKNANVAATQKTYSIQHNGHGKRWLSSFLIFPQQGAAGPALSGNMKKSRSGPITTRWPTPRRQSKTSITSSARWKKFTRPGAKHASPRATPA